MKLFTKHNGLSLILAVSALFCCSSAMAENRLFIEPFTIGGYDAVDVPVMLDNTDPVAGIQFNIVLPDELELAGNPVKNPDRMLNGQTLAFRNNKVLVTSANPNAVVVGTEGPVLFIPVKVKDGMLDNQTVQLGLRNITMTNYSGSEQWKQDNFFTDVELQKYKVEAYTSTEEFVINPGGTHVFEFALRNNCEVMGFQADVQLPEGFTFEGEADNMARCSSTAYMNMYANPDNTTRFIMSDLSGGYAVNGIEGAVFTIKVKAPESFTAEKAVITVSNLEVSYAPGKGVKGDGYTVTVVNGLTAYNSACGEVTRLQQLLADTLGEIAAECPDVKDNFDGSSVSESIDNLAAAIDAAYADGTLTTDYSSVMAPVEDIEAAIAALKADAVAAQAKFVEEQRVAANQAAYAKTLDEIAALQAKLDAAKAEAAEICADADVTAEVDAAQAEIDRLKDGADKALAAVAVSGEYEYTVDGTEAEKLIAAVTAEAGRVAANQAAYAKTLDEIAALQAKLDAAKAEVADKYPGVDVDEAMAAVQSEIDNIKAGADEALEAVAESGEYSYTVDGTAVDTMIAAVLADAERVAANNEAYAKVSDEIAALQAKLDAAKAEAAEISADADVTAEVDAAQAEIDRLKEGADKAFEAVAQSGVFEYTIDSTEAEKLIEAVTAEARRVAANTEAYNKAVAEIDELENQLSETISEVISEYPDASVAAEIIAAQNAIAAARRAAEAEADRVADEGEYSYTPDSELIGSLIKAILDKAKLTGIANIVADNIPDDVRIYDLNGRELKHPAPGTVVVLRAADGSVTKALVK